MNAPSPELPISVHLDGNLAAVDFMERLQRAGLQLRQGSDDAYAVITLAEPQAEPQPVAKAIGEHIEQQRRTLNRAAAVLAGAELCAEYLPEMSIVADAVTVARDLVEQVVAALDSTNLNRPQE